jgi:hypothetical protein
MQVHQQGKERHRRDKITRVTGILQAASSRAQVLLPITSGFSNAALAANQQDENLKAPAILLGPGQSTTAAKGK